MQSSHLRYADCAASTQRGCDDNDRYHSWIALQRWESDGGAWQSGVQG
jgi:hypothetical protein